MGNPCDLPDKTDPFDDPTMDALERGIEHPSGFEDPLAEHDQPLMDDIGRALDALEASIEGTVIRPTEPIPVEPLPPAPEPPGLVSQGPSEGPPLEPEHRRLDWISLNPAPAAMPFFTHEGLHAPSDRPRSRGSTGIRNNAGSRARWCPRDQCTVDEADCPSCDEFGDHGDGVERCYFDWLEENQDEGKRDREND